MTLSIEEINRLAAEACGYTVVREGSRYYLRQAETRRFRTCKSEALAWWRAPDYCADRNALPELYSRIEHDSAWKFVEELNRLICGENGGRAMRWVMITASPLLQTVAALKALDKWPEGAEIPEEGEI